MYRVILVNRTIRRPVTLEKMERTLPKGGITPGVGVAKEKYAESQSQNRVRFDFMNESQYIFA